MEEKVKVKIDPVVNENVYRRSKTGALFFSWVCQGMYNEVLGPTLPDLKSHVQCNYEEISRALSARSAGLFLGALIGGVIHDKWARHRDLIIAVSLLLSAVSVIVVPWCGSLWMLGVVFHLMGHGHALLSTGGNPTIAVLWGSKSEGPYQLLHLGFGVGAILGILIARPFISDHTVSHSNESHIESLDLNLTASDIHLSNSSENFTINHHTTLAPIEFPYIITGACCLLACIIFLVYFFIPSPPQFIPNQSRWRDIFNPRRCSGGQTLFGIQMFVLIFIFFMFIVGLERGFGKFIFSYAVESGLGLSASTASWLGLFFWISYTIGRLSSFVLTRFVRTHILLFIQTTATLIASILLNFFPDSVVGVFTLTIVFGFFKSQLYPTCLGWANHYIEISSMTIAVIDTGSSTGGMLIQWLTGYTFEYHGPHTFLYVIVALSIGVCITYTVMYVVASRRGERFTTPPPNLLPPSEVNGLLENGKGAEKDEPFISPRGSSSTES